MSTAGAVGETNSNTVTLDCDFLSPPNREVYTDQKSYREALDLFKAAQKVCDSIVVSNNPTVSGVTKGSGLLTSNPDEISIDTYIKENWSHLDKTDQFHIGKKRG